LLLFERWKCPLTGVSPAKMLRSARMAAMTGCTAASWEVFEVRAGRNKSDILHLQNAAGRHLVKRAQSRHSLRRASMTAMRDKTDLGRNRRFDRFRPMH
jgi:hypothetical protein